MLEHPDIERVERTGYPVFIQEKKEYGVDALGNEVMIGDEILVYEDEFFLIETLGSEAIEVLEILGAEREIAK